MAARLTALLPRLAALVLVWLLAAAGFTLAAERRQTDASPPPAATGAEEERPDVLVVPDVRRQAYVFAKGILQDDGFAWRVGGSVRGYSANTVVAQEPVPGTRVVDNGAPTVVLRLERNPGYAENGLPEDSSSYRGTPILLLRDWREAREATIAREAARSAVDPGGTGAVETSPTTTTATTTTAAVRASNRRYRTPDFAVRGAPREPADELRLPERARRLERHVAAAGKPTPRLVDFWLYQHSWIVTGARYGWKDGDEALRILIRVDERLQRRFGFGARSEAVARRALAEVLAKKER